jgi:hypothetical protein
MNPLTLQGLATGFIATSIAMGLPSIATLLLYVGYQIRNRLSTPTTEPNFGDNPDAILLMLKGMTQAIGFLGRAAGTLGQIAMNFLAGVSAVALVLALALWFTGRGLQAEANWGAHQRVHLTLTRSAPIPPARPCRSNPSAACS